MNELIDQLVFHEGANEIKTCNILDEHIVKHKQPEP
jgi:hypothetical protein